MTTLPICIANFKYMIEMPRERGVRGSEYTGYWLDMIFLFAPLISKWIDESRDMEASERAAVASEALGPISSFADWEMLDDGRFKTPKTLQRRLKGVITQG